MAKVKQSFTQLVDTITVSNKTTKESVVKLLDGRPLGSPINSIPEGKEFPIELNGKIEIRSFEGIKSAHFLTHQGVSIRVNSSFNPSLHKAGFKSMAICNVLPKDLEATPARTRDIKFASLVIED